MPTTCIVVGILYLVIGLVTAELANGAAPIPARNRWRLAPGDRDPAFVVAYLLSLVLRPTASPAD